MRRVFKWAFDRVFALCLLLLLAPVMLVLALLVRVIDGPPVLHHETRVGLRGTPFTLHKFRSMETAAGAGVAPEDDPRLTRLGLLLRRWRMDELPQLVNVIAGDMSLVGPRPMVPHHVAALAPADAAELLSVRPGLTGASALAFIGDDAALSGRSEAEADYLAHILPEKVALELDYVRRWRLRTDVALLGRTVWQLGSPGARRRSRERVAALLDRS